MKRDERRRIFQQSSLNLDPMSKVQFPPRIGRRLLQDNSSSIISQPSFIALLSVIAFLVVAILIAVAILCYRCCAHRSRAKRRSDLHSKLHPTKKINLSSTDQAHLGTPSTSSSYSLRSSRRLFANPQVQQTSSIGQSINSTIPSVVPSRLLQQSMIDAYLNDINYLQPNQIDPKQLNSYLFIDLHSTSSETYPDRASKQYLQDNTTTSGYDTSTGAEDKLHRTSFKYRRRRLPYYHRQRRRSTMALKRSRGPRFLMRERSLPNNLLRLPQLRQQPLRLFSMKRSHRLSMTSTTSTSNPDFVSTSISSTTDDYGDHHSYHLNRLKTIEEEKPSTNNSPYQNRFVRQPYFFEKVSTTRGDDSDMVIYDDLPIRNDGGAYVNDSIIV